MDPEIHQKLVDARLKALEAEVRRLRLAMGWSPEEPVAADLAPGKPTESPSAPDTVTPGTAPSSDPHTAAHAPGLAPKRVRSSGEFERWVGENALLVVGLLALVAAAGFTLKYAFDQGWVSPGLRVLAGVLSGVAVAAYGSRVQSSGMRRFGGALVGGGGAIIYLSLWGAAGPYEFISPTVGVFCLAAVSGFVVWRAVASDTELLAALAAIGAYMAPPLLPNMNTPDELLLAYCALVAAACGYAAMRRDWPVTFGVITAGFFLVPALTTVGTGSALVVGYLVAGGVVGMWIAQSRGWDRVVGVVFVQAWLLLVGHSDGIRGSAAWLTLFSAPLLAMPSLLDFLRTPAPPAAESEEDALQRHFVGPPFREQIRHEWWGYLALSAFAWSVVSNNALYEPLGDFPLLALTVVAAPYLWVAISRANPGTLAIAAGVIAAGCALQFDGVAAEVSWALVALLTATLTRTRVFAPGRWIGYVLTLLAGLWLLQEEFVRRAPTDPAFVGAWPLALWAIIATYGLLAGPLWGEPPAKASFTHLKYLRRSLWVSGGLTLLIGGTQEIFFYFGEAASGDNALARDVTVSAFWLVYAGALLAFGFWKDRRAVRISGLVVTTLAILKVAFNDLTQLEALYRVAALVLTAVIALVAARAYHRRSKEADSEGNAPE